MSVRISQHESQLSPVIKRCTMLTTPAPATATEIHPRLQGSEEPALLQRAHTTSLLRTQERPIAPARLCYPALTLEGPPGAGRHGASSFARCLRLQERQAASSRSPPGCAPPCGPGSGLDGRPLPGTPARPSAPGAALAAALLLHLLTQLDFTSPAPASLYPVILVLHRPWKFVRRQHRPAQRLGGKQERCQPWGCPRHHTHPRPRGRPGRSLASGGGEPMANGPGAGRAEPLSSPRHPGLAAPGRAPPPPAALTCSGAGC